MAASPPAKCAAKHPSSGPRSSRTPSTAVSLPVAAFGASLRAAAPDTQRLLRLALLGAGAFGDVFLCEPQGGGALVAVKRQAAQDHGESTVASVAREAALLRRVACPLVVRLDAAVQTTRYVLLITEFVSGGTLFDRVLYGDPVPVEHIVVYAAQLAVALRHVHSREVAFRDLKPQNVLVSAEGNIKLCDFGWSRVLRAGERSFTVCGTAEFMSPEQACAPHASHSFACDWWALGMVIFELAMGHSPFELPGAPCLPAQEALAGGYVPSLPASYPRPLAALTRSLLQRREKSRAGWREVSQERVLRAVLSADSTADDVLRTTARMARYVPPVRTSWHASGFEHFGSPVVRESTRELPLPADLA